MVQVVTSKEFPAITRVDGREGEGGLNPVCSVVGVELSLCFIVKAPSFLGMWDKKFSVSNNVRLKLKQQHRKKEVVTLQERVVSKGLCK